MAYSQGTATSFLDFYNKLRDFLTTDSALVTATQNWTQIAGSVGTLTLTDTITLQGPGLAGTDQVRVKIKPVYSVVDNRYNLEFVGVPNWNGAISQDAQFNMSNPVYVHLWNSSMPYTIVANGRRFVFVCQVSTTVQAGYGGFFLPYALPAEYPYPLAVGGSSDTSTWNYTQANIEHSHFVNPSDSLRVYTPSNTWISIQNFVNSSFNYSWQVGGPSCLLPYPSAAGSSFRTAWNVLRECFGGEYPLHPLILITTVPSSARLGVLDGCSQLPGIGNTHGSIVVVDSVDHLVVQNVTRTDNWLGYWALKLE
jgi:hypothetical protein